MGDPVGAAVALVGGLGTANAATQSSGSSALIGGSAMHHVDGMGMNGFGKTGGSYEGRPSQFVNSAGYWCDKGIKSASRSGCEVGAKSKKAPNKQHDPLYITVPLGFNTPGMKMECPNKLTCIDHPRSMDLKRLAKTLGPIFGTTPHGLRP